ncbi:hypothetical protein DUNSADRAFT_14563 [Dunaliella salina]|uniref:Uncharacterized protein n=1 Tax=Dunaliella salina TaxID=3046 RepID=A0ABQ7G751_DUNSA|nr:hypothetical protein DUNSADRAFT_14563 [Dunaliella salina]|eukprot:KAF5830445.1 hypothetical protein DUNSADRAFT_14563 [Dunaliella salina]
MQVQRLQAQQKSMKGALLAAMDNLSQAQTRQQEEAGGVAEEVRAANRATEGQLASAMAQLQNVCRAAAESTNQTVSLAAQQRDQTASLAAQQKEMVEKMGGEREVAQKAIAVLEAQLSTAHSAASQADRERQQIQRQMIASSLLGRNQDRRLEETLKALRHNAQNPPPATTTTTTRATTSGAQDSMLRAEHEPPITHHLPGQTAAHSTTAIPASTATSIAAGTSKQPLPKLRQFRPRSAAAATAATGAAPAVPHHTITTTTATTSAQPHQPKGCGRDTHSHTMQGKSTGPSSMGRQSAPLALGGGGGFGGGADAIGAATGAVLERSAALRMALQVLASSPHSLPEPTAPNEFAHTVGASEPARPNTNATRRPDAAAHVTLLAAQGGNLPTQNSAQDQQQQGPRQAAGDIQKAAVHLPSDGPASSS